VAQAWYSAIRLSYWSNDKKLFTQSAISAPNSGDALYRYAKALKSQNQRSQEFTKAAEAAVQVFPSYPPAQQLLGQHLIEISTHKSDVCRGYQHLINAYLGDPSQAILPSIVAVIPAFCIRHPQTVAGELQECGIDLSIEEAQMINDATKAAFGAVVLDSNTGKELPCNIACQGARAMKDNDPEKATNIFKELWKAHPNWKYLQAFILNISSAASEFNPAYNIILAPPNLENSWKKYCASIGYSLSDACRKHFKVGIDGVPWRASPLHDNEK
jgi:hypothetical protein